MSDTEQARACVVFEGTVQGVGFRYTTVQIASSFDVTGYVKNCRDGSVELVAEGERGEVEAVVASVSRRMARYVRDREVTWSEATGEFEGFGVRFR
ncbi:MAG: acylphosphatase [Candidatus Brocadiia bacterium]